METKHLAFAIEALQAKQKLFHSEAGFQFSLAWELQKIMPEAKIRLEYTPPFARDMHIDIYITDDNGAYPIELRHKSKAIETIVDDEYFKLKNHGAQDPNYVAGSNTDLAGITVEGFLLSPAFSLENTEYVIWLPYETENITVGATAADSNASVTVEGGENLATGADNVIKVICTAEDGTQKTYTIIAKRAAAHGETTDPTEPSEAPTEPQETEPETTEPEETEPVVAPTEPQKPAETCKNSGIPVVVLVLSIAASLAVGFAAGMFVDNKYLRKR